MRGFWLLLAPLALFANCPCLGQSHTMQNLPVGKTLVVNWADQAVGASLPDLALPAKASLRATKRVEDIRLTVYVHDRTAEQFKKDITFLLDHGEMPPAFLWQTTEAEPNTFILNRTALSFSREAKAADAFKQQSALWLTEYRKALTLSGIARDKAAANAQSPFFDVPLDKPDEASSALTSLSGAELQTLLTQGKMQLSLDRVPDLRQKFLDNASKPFAAPGDEARRDEEYNKGLANLSLEVSFTPSTDSVGTYELGVQTVPFSQKHSYGVLIDPLGIYSPEKTTAKSLNEKDPSPEIDLTKAISRLKKPYTLASCLSAISEASGASIYCEYFPSLISDRGERIPVETKSSLHALLNQVATAYQYNIVKRDDAYFLWSKTWFWDRPNLVPYRLVTDWRTKAGSGQLYTFDDVLHMATQLSNGQREILYRLKLNPGMLHPNTVDALRVIATLSAKQRERAFSPLGLPISTLSEDKKTQLIAALRPNLIVRTPENEPTVPSGEENVLLFLNKKGNKEMPTLVEMSLRRENESALATLPISLKPPSPPR